MTRNRWLGLTFAALILGLTSGYLLGGRSGKLSINPALAATSGRDTQSIDQALMAATAAVEHQEWQAGYDDLAFALRVSPGDRSVFDGGCKFVQAARNQSEAADLFADSLFQKLDAALPFLPFDQIADARKRLELLAAEPEAKEPPRKENDFSAVYGILKETLKPEIPVNARLALVQEAGAELATLSRRPLQERTADYWSGYEAAKREHDRCQNLLASQLYQQSPLGPQSIGQWNQQVRSYFRACDEGGLDPAKRDPEAAALLGDGQRILREVTNFSDAGVAEAAEFIKSGTLEYNLNAIVRARDWHYNRWCYAHIERVSTSDFPSPLARLEALANIDESRLHSFVAQRFDQEWARWFEQCGSPDDKLAATKSRILRGIKP